MTYIVLYSIVFRSKPPVPLRDIHDSTAPALNDFIFIYFSSFIRPYIMPDAPPLRRSPTSENTEGSGVAGVPNALCDGDEGRPDKPQTQVKEDAKMIRKRRLRLQEQVTYTCMYAGEQGDGDGPGPGEKSTIKPRGGAVSLALRPLPSLCLVIAGFQPFFYTAWLSPIVLWFAVRHERIYLSNDTES